MQFKKTGNNILVFRGRDLQSGMFVHISTRKPDYHEDIRYLFKIGNHISGVIMDTML